MQVTSDQITLKLKEILSEIKEEPVLLDEISESTHILNEIGLDSLQMINFVLMLEDEFGIEMNFQDFSFASYSTVGAIAELMAKLMKCQVAS